MKIEVHFNESAVARAAARLIAAEAVHAVAQRGRFVVALSGARTPWLMLRALARRDDVPWNAFTSCRPTSASRHRDIPTAT